MTAQHTVDAAVAATIPMALTHLADHITTHQLPSPAFIEIPGALVGEAEIPSVKIVLDHPRVDPWLASIEASITDAAITRHQGGSWYDVNGVANCIKVRLSWYVLTTPIDRVETTVDHETCRGGCGDTLCYCRGREQSPCDGTVEGACRHGEYLCHACMTGCTECADDLAQARAEGRDR